MNSIVQSSSINGSVDAANSEVIVVKRRRLISQTDKRRILRDYDRCKKPGERGALLRQERVYSSMLAGWRKQFSGADRAAQAAVRRGPKVDPATAQKRRDEQRNREIARLTRQLVHANAIIEVQKKLCTLLGLPTAQEPASKD